MARPLKEGLEYFTHDTDASTDEKMETFRTIYKNDGYAFYFILLERIYRTNNAELNIADAETCKILAKKIMVSLPKFHAMIGSAIKWGLFDKDAFTSRNVLTSTGIQKRAKLVLDKRLYARNDYTKKELTHNQIQSDGVSATETHQETHQETPQETHQETHQETMSETPQSIYSKVNKSKDSKDIILAKMITVYEANYKIPISFKVRELLIDILEEYGYDIFCAATKKMAGTSKCTLPYVAAVMEDYKFNGIPSSNGGKPQGQSKPLGSDGWEASL